MTRLEPNERPEAVTGLGDFIRAHRAEILAAWEGAVRTMPVARDLERPALLDHIPDLLDRIALIAEELEAGGSPRLPNTVAELHAVERLDEGFDLSQVVAEYAILRDCIIRLWEGSAHDPEQLRSLRVVNQAIDKAVAISVTRYTNARDLTLQALDRIANAALDSHDLEDLLRRLLTVLIETTSAVDTAAIFLRENGHLRARATVGLERDVEERFSEKIGDGFVGAIAAEGRPMALQAASEDPIVKSPAIRAAAVRALYGIPLVEEGRVIGVAHMGSQTAHEFSKQDQRLLSAMAHRATAAISQHMLREASETAAAELGFLADASKLLASSLTYEETLDKIAHLPVPKLADWCVVDLTSASGAVRRVAVAHHDPRMVEFAHAWARKYPPDWASERGASQVIRTGVPEFANDVPDELLVRSARDPEHLEAMRSLGFRSYLIAPLQIRDRVVGAITLINTTTRRYAERDVAFVMELGRRAAFAVENARLYEEAREAVRLRERILAIVSHDLRNPLAAIDLSASALHETLGSDPRTTKHIDIIQRSATRMEHMISDLLDMASIQAGRLGLETSPVDAARIVAEIVESCRARASEAGLTIEGEASAGLRASCDRDRIIQVLGNLVGNAIKFSPPGGAISVRAAQSGDRVRFVVADTGPGIAADDLPHLFEPYWSAKQHAKQGSGLGLYIAKGIVDAHGGEIGVETRPGAGTTFYFTLPRATKSDSSVRSSTAGSRA